MSLITQGGHYEWKVVNGTNTYYKENISSGTLSDGLYEKIGIGNAVSRQLDLRLWNVTIDTDSPIVLSFREAYVDGTYSAWTAKGTYFIDTVGTSPYSEYTEITAYDANRKADVPFMKTGEFASTTDQAVVQAIATDLGVAIEANTAAILAAPKVIDEVPSIGDNGTTCREMLGVVAAMRGGNFYINDDNELELVALIGRYQLPQLIKIDSDGLFVTLPYTLAEDTDYVVGIDANGDCVSMLFSDVADATNLVYLYGEGLFYVAAWEDIQELAPPVISPFVVGNEVAKFDVSPTETVTRVEVWAGSSTSFRSPEGLTEAAWEALGGIILSVSMPIMASQALADELYAAYNGFTYVPYEADKVYISPDLKLGTRLTIKNDTVLLTSRSLNISPLGYCDLSAGATAAVVSHYPVMTPTERSLKKDIDENYTRIQVNDDAIIAEASRAQGAEENLASTITQTADGLRVELNDYKEEVAHYLSYEGGVLTLGETDSNFRAQLDSTELAFTGADGQKAAWISNTQLNIKEAVIETDEKFKATSGNWVQQVVDDHFQIKWVAN